MRQVESLLEARMLTGEAPCDASSECLVHVDSKDEFGESAASFNALVVTLSDSLQMESAVRRFGERLSSQLDLDDLTTRALGLLIDHTQSDGGALLPEIEGELSLAAARGLDDPAELIGSDHVRRVVKTGARAA